MENRLYRYLVVGEIRTYAKDSPMILRRTRLEEVVLACNGEAAIDKLFAIFIKDYWKDDNTELDDVSYKCIGPADVCAAVTLDGYIPSVNYTMTVGELIDFLGKNFDADSKFYLVDNSREVPLYGGVGIDSFGYITEKE